MCEKYLKNLLDNNIRYVFKKQQKGTVKYVLIEFGLVTLITKV